MICKYLSKLFKKEQPKPPHVDPIEPVDEKPQSEYRWDDDNDGVPNDWAKDYLELWKTVKIRPEHSSTLNWYVSKIIRYQHKYKPVEAATRCPWEIVGIIHGMEASFNFDGILHNGEKIIGTGKKTVLVPKGRGPFSTWEQAAIDALQIKNIKLNWSNPIEVLYFLEKFNGLGYRKYHPTVKSPYLWGLTNHHLKGKYTSDGKFDYNASTSQCGAAIILKSLKPSWLS